MASGTRGSRRRLEAVEPPKIEALPSEVVPVTDLKPHPRNYRAHPPDQLDHLEASLREHGQYRNVVVARDNTVLAGHGVLLAAQRAGMAEIEIKRADVDPHEPSALRLLAGDNEIARLVDVDDRALAELLQPLAADDPAALLGTGVSEHDLAELLSVTGIAGEQQAAFLDDLVVEGDNAITATEGGHLQRPARMPRQLVISASEEERAEIVAMLNQIRDEQQIDTLTSALLWALHRCLAPASS